MSSRTGQKTAAYPISEGLLEGVRMNLFNFFRKKPKVAEPAHIITPQEQKRMAWAREKILNKLRKHRKYTRLLIDATNCLVCNKPLNRAPGQQVGFCSREHRKAWRHRKGDK